MFDNKQNVAAQERLAERWGSSDELGILTQLGAAPVGS